LSRLGPTHMLSHILAPIIQSFCQAQVLIPLKDINQEARTKWISAEEVVGGIGAW